MVPLLSSTKAKIIQGLESLKNHQSEDFHQVFDQIKKELKEFPRNKQLMALLAAIQAEEYEGVRDFSSALNLISEALRYDNHYTYVLFQAIVYEKMKMGYKTIPIYEELLVRDAEKSNLDQSLYYFILNNIATCWYQMGELPEWHRQKYGKQVKFEYAQEHYLKVLQAPRTVSEAYQPLMTNAKNGVGYTYAQLGKIKEARDYFQQALDLKNKLINDHPDIVINSLNGLAWCEFKDGNFPLASHYLTKANRIAIFHYGETHEITLKLATSLALTWRERMGYPEIGIHLVKNRDNKNQNFKNDQRSSVSGSFYYSPKASVVHESKIPKAEEVTTKTNDLTLFLSDDISQKIFLLKTFLHSLSGHRMVELGLLQQLSKSETNSNLTETLNTKNKGVETSDGGEKKVPRYSNKLFSIL